jgi:hypothetical protein
MSTENITPLFQLTSTKRYDLDDICSPALQAELRKR